MDKSLYRRVIADDRLEASYETGFEYRELFLGLGSESLNYVHGLHDDLFWAKAIEGMILSEIEIPQLKKSMMHLLVVHFMTFFTTYSIFDKKGM